MKMKLSIETLRKTPVTLAVIVLLVLVIIGMLLNTGALASRITGLENQIASSEKKLNSYQRTFCSNTSGQGVVVQSDALTKYNISSAGFERTYQVHTPAHYDPTVRYPVILSFDGIEGSGNRMELYSGLDVLPAVVVYPDSLVGTKGYSSWEGAPYSVNTERDTQFVHELLATLPSQYCVDSTRIFAVGMSNGGSFATIVGCELGNQIRAVASISGAYYTTCKEEERTPSLLVMHSTDDRQVPFLGSTARRLPKVSAWVDKQAVERQCQTKMTTKRDETSVSYNWLKCSDNSTVRLTVLDKQAHGWLKLPQTSGQKIQGTAGYIWKFFEESSYRG